MGKKLISRAQLPKHSGTEMSEECQNTGGQGKSPSGLRLAIKTGVDSPENNVTNTP